MTAVAEPTEVLHHPDSKALRDETLVHLDPKSLSINPHNLRLIGSPAIRDLSDLDSIATTGVIEPLVITPERVIVCGHRRQARAIQAKLRTVPCVVRVLTDAEQVEMALIENLGRRGLSATEEANAYQMLFDLGVTDIAKRVGVPELQVADRLELLSLPASVRTALDEGRITFSLAKQFGLLKDKPDEIEKLIKRAARYGPGTDNGVALNDLWEINGIIQAIRKKEVTAAAKQEAKAKGWSVVAMPPGWGREEGKPVRIGKTGDAIDVPLAKHKKGKCHAVAIEVDYRGEKATLVPICTDPGSHKDVVDPATKRREAAVRAGEPDYKAERAQQARIETALLERQPDRLAVWRSMMATDDNTLIDLHRLGVVGQSIAAYDNDEICTILEIDGGADPGAALLTWLTEDPDLREQRERRFYKATLVRQFESRLNDIYRGWNTPLVVHILTALTESGYALNEGETELRGATTALQSRMATDDRFRYVIVREENEAEGDEEGDYEGDPEVEE